MDINAVILTKSYKNGGYCVAGINLDTQSWIRFVSSDVTTHGAITDRDMQYDSFLVCKPFDVVRVPVLRYCPATLQPENYLIDRSKRWEKLGTMSLDEVLEIYPFDNDIFIFKNTWSYLNPVDAIDIDHSLVMVRVYDLQINHDFQGSPAYKKCAFSYRGNQYYFMSITDPEYRHSEPTIFIGDAILIISIPEAPDNNNRLYKCVSKIIPI